MGGRPRKPTSLHVIEGTRTRTDRSAEPVDSRPLGEPPKHLKAAQRRVWEEFVESMPAGVLAQADRYAVEVVVLLIAKMRTAAGLTAAEIGTLQRGLASLGMTPADRSRVGLAKKEPQKAVSPWDRL